MKQSKARPIQSNLILTLTYHISGTNFVFKTSGVLKCQEHKVSSIVKVMELLYTDFFKNGL